MVEIGPGLGALTEALLASGCQVDAIELDRDLATPLLAAFSIYPGFHLHQADALTFDFPALASPTRPLRVVGNLPYNISTPLIFRILESADSVEDMHFMLQREVVHRLVSTPGNKDWGRLGIMAQFYCETEMLFEVPPEAFDPAPKVHSAVVRLRPRPSPEREQCGIAALDRVVRAAFSKRRKTLRNSLKGVIEASVIEALGLDPVARPETLSLQDFAALAQILEDTRG